MSASDGVQSTSQPSTRDLHPRFASLEDARNTHVRFGNTDNDDTETRGRSLTSGANTSSQSSVDSRSRRPTSDRDDSRTWSTRTSRRAVSSGSNDGYSRYYYPTVPTSNGRESARPLRPSLSCTPRYSSPASSRRSSLTTAPTNPSAGPSTDPSTTPPTGPSTTPPTDPSTNPPTDPSTTPSTGPSIISPTILSRVPTWFKPTPTAPPPAALAPDSSIAPSTTPEASKATDPTFASTWRSRLTDLKAWSTQILSALDILPFETADSQTNLAEDSTRRESVDTTPERQSDESDEYQDAVERHSVESDANQSDANQIDADQSDDDRSLASRILASQRRAQDLASRTSAWCSGYQNGETFRNRSKASHFWKRSGRTATGFSAPTYKDPTLKSAYDRGYQDATGFSAFPATLADPNTVGDSKQTRTNTYNPSKRSRPWYKRSTVHSFFDNNATDCDWQSIDAYHDAWYRPKHGKYFGKYSSAKLSGFSPTDKTTQKSGKFKWSHLDRTRARAEEELSRLTKNDKTFYTGGAIAAQVKDHNYWRYQKELNDESYEKDLAEAIAQSNKLASETGQSFYPPEKQGPPPPS